MNFATNSALKRTLLLLGVLALGAGVVLAVHDIGLFELEGDAVNGVSSGDDWDNVLGFASPPGADEAHSFIADGLAASIFTTGGSKDDLNVPNWRYTDGNVPAKDEIVNAFAAAYVNSPDANPSDDNAGGDLILYFGADRYANNGDAQIGFWFFKQEVFLGPNQRFVDSSGDPAVHSVGDILVLSDFTQGGRISTIKVYEWVGTGGDTNDTLDLLFTGTDCVTTAPANDAACATVNASPTSAPWAFTPKFGSSGTFPTGSLFEGGINLSRLARLNSRPAPGCFGSFLAETRSSQSVDAQLKDFALGGFGLCDARISIAEDATNEVRDDHTFTITVEKKGPPNFDFSPAVGVEVTASLEAGSVGSFVGPDTCTTDNNGECTVTITSSVAGTSTVSASASVTVDGTTFDVETDGEGGNSGPAVKTWVDAKISIGDSATNEVGAEHTFTVTLMKNEGSGFVAAAGEDIDFTLSSEFGASCEVDEAASTCDDAGANTDGSGQCTIVFSSATSGQCVGSASATLSVGGISLFRETDGSFDNSGEATKTYVDASIAIDPPRDTNKVGDSHTFTVTVKADAGDGDGLQTSNVPDGTIVTVSFSPSDPDSVTDNCGTSGTVNGVCTVDISHNSPAVFTAHASVTVELGGVSLFRETDGQGNNSGDAEKAYADAFITIEADGANEVGDSHTFTVNVRVDDGSGEGPAPDGTVVTVTFSPQAPETVDDNCDDGTVDGMCTVEINSSSAGSFTASASASLTVGGEGFSLSTDGTGNNSGPATKVYADASIAISPENATNNVDSEHTFTITVTADDGSGFGPVPVAGVNPVVTISPTPDSVTDNCASVGTDASGECTVVINSSSPGTFVANASVTVLVSTSEGDVSLTRDTDPSTSSIPAGPDGSGPATKVYEAGRIIIEKVCDPAEDPQQFPFTTDYGDNGFELGCGDSNDSGFLASGPYNVSESVPGGWALTGIECSGNVESQVTIGDGGFFPANSVNIQLEAGETVTCAFTNTKLGTIIVEKQTNPDGAPGSFTFSGDAAGSLSDGGQIVVSDLLPGNYSSVEADPTPNFDLTSIVCNDSNSSGNVNTRTASFVLDPGETVTCVFTNRQRGMARVVKTVLGLPPSGQESFSFDLRQGATLTSLGTVLESGVANAGNGGIINFSTKLVPGTTYQLCETGILPGWDTTLVGLGAFVPGGSLPDPDNSTLCINFTVEPGETKEFQIDNTPPPGGLAHTIGFWKNWTSCDGRGNQAPVLDQTLAAAGGGILIGDVFVDTCLEAIRLLDKSQIISGKKMASDPAYNLAAQLLAAQLNIVAQAGSCSAANTAIAQAQALLDAINFTGNGPYRASMSSAQRQQANNLAAILDSYNNNLLCF